MWSPPPPMCRSQKITLIHSRASFLATAGTPYAREPFYSKHAKAVAFMILTLLEGTPTFEALRVAADARTKSSSTAQSLHPQVGTPFWGTLLGSLYHKDDRIFGVAFESSNVKTHRQETCEGLRRHDIDWEGDVDQAHHNPHTRRFGV